jgi:hypothetical protein
MRCIPPHRRLTAQSSIASRTTRHNVPTAQTRATAPRLRYPTAVAAPSYVGATDRRSGGLTMLAHPSPVIPSEASRRFFPAFASCERVGLRREESLFDLSVERAPLPVKLLAQIPPLRIHPLNQRHLLLPPLPLNLLLPSNRVLNLSKRLKINQLHRLVS